MHKDHEGLHNFLFVLLFVFLLVSQIGLFFWKKKHYRSFQNITLLGLWAIPFLLSVYSGFWRMIFVWTIFSAITFYLMKQASVSLIPADIPKRIYGWFFLVYRLCYGTALFGYILIMLDIIGLGVILPITEWVAGASYSYVGFLLIFYGLYFGVLGRDCAEMCTDRLASKMGFTGKGIPAKQLSPNTCCICGEMYERDGSDSVSLNCKHCFHEWCIRGWTIVGKKDTCPYCSEKVNLKQLYTNPWEKQGIMWANLMDALRYLIVWNPIILTAIQLMISFLDPGA